jgi:hypothetical protein
MALLALGFDDRLNVVPPSDAAFDAAVGRSLEQLAFTAGGEREEEEQGAIHRVSSNVPERRTSRTGELILG